MKPFLLPGSLVPTTDRIKLELKTTAVPVLVLHWEQAEGPVGRRLTSGAALQAGSVGRHHAWVSGLPRLPHADLEGTAGDVASVELHVDEIQAVLSGDKPHCVLIW